MNVLPTGKGHQILAGAVVASLILASGLGVEAASQQKKSDPAALRPFQVELCRVSGMTGCDDAGPDVAVPFVTSDGEPVLRLVIEYVSGDCRLNADGVVLGIHLRTVVNGTTVPHTFIPVRLASGEWVTSHMTRIYADPGSLVSFSVGVLSAPGSVCRVKLSGSFAVE